MNFHREVTCSDGVLVQCTGCHRGHAMIRVQRVPHAVWEWLCGACASGRHPAPSCFTAPLANEPGQPRRAYDADVRV